jgi:hypothetical protein
MTRQKQPLDVTTSNAERRSLAAADRPRETEAGGPPSAWATSPRQAQQHDRLVQMRSATRSSDSLPDSLRHGIESLSGLDMSAIRVHRNSSQPASLQAHAFAQGSNIHLGAGQERHLPHEAWHLVQQAQGRVPPTAMLPSGVAINDSAELEREADRMGDQAHRVGASAVQRVAAPAPVTSAPLSPLGEVVQAKGERTAVLSTRDATRSAAEPIRRGNRRASVSGTGGRSAAKLDITYSDPAHQIHNTGYRNQVGDLRQHVKNRMVLSGAYSADQANHLIDNNDTFLQAKAIEEISVGNCGEFGMVVFSHLVQNTTGQYAYRCAMSGNVPGTTRAYDHCFVFTYPNNIPFVPNVTGVGGVDRNLATIADAWDGYQVMTLAHFMNGGNAYGTQLADNNVVIKEGSQATGAQVFSPAIEGYIREWAVTFNLQFANEMLDPTSVYATVAAARALNPSGFGTQGSNVVGVNDSRTIAQKLANSTPAERADILTRATDAELFSHINTLSTAAGVALLAELPDARVVTYLDQCWNRGLLQKFALASAFPYKADIVAAMDPLRAHNILQLMPHTQQTRIRRDMPSTARQAIDDAGVPFGVMVV